MIKASQGNQDSLPYLLIISFICIQIVDTHVFFSAGSKKGNDF